MGRARSVVSCSARISIGELVLNSSLHMLENSGPLPLLDKPYEVSELILGFLGGG